MTLRRLQSGPRRRGTILIVTIWIILAMAGLVLALAPAMRVEAGAAANYAAELQADAIEQGAIQYVLTHVDSLKGQIPTDSNMPCEAVRVGDGAFWIIRPNFDSDTEFAFGVVDEASKLNLNTASKSALSLLPNMPTELGPSTIDWRDTDETVTSGGAESEYYQTLDDPYQCKNGPLETVEELMLVRGASRDVMYGLDVNRNGVRDAWEDSTLTFTTGTITSASQFNRGIAPFVTVYSSENNDSNSGTKRVNINTASAQSLKSLLEKKMSAARATAVMNIVAPPASERSGVRPPRLIFLNIFDFAVRCKLTSAELEGIADEITTSTATTLKGLVNVNTAPAEVLACLGLDSSDVASLIAKRTDGTTPPTNVGWVLGVLESAKAVAIGSLITVRSYQFSADIVSVSGNGKAFRRCRIVVDAKTSPSKVVYRQNLTALGWPLSDDILQGLRSGASLDSISPKTNTLNMNMNLNMSNSR